MNHYPKLKEVLWGVLAGTIVAGTITWLAASFINTLRYLFH